MREGPQQAGQHLRREEQNCDSRETCFPMASWPPWGLTDPDKMLPRSYTDTSSTSMFSPPHMLSMGLVTAFPHISTGPL